MHKILIVEDEAAAAMHLRKYLESAGYAVVGQAFTGAQAVERARSLSPELVLMDIVLQGDMNGIEASEIIKSELNVPILFISAYSDDSIVKQAKSVNPYGYILKPFQENQIKVALEVAFEKIASDRQLYESREKYHQMVQSTHEGMLVIQDDLIASANRTAIEVLGYRPEEIISRPFLNFFHPDEREAVHDGYLRRLDGQTTGVYACRVTDAKGDVKWLEINFIAMHWEGRPAVLCLLADVTGRKLAQEESNKYRSHLEKLVEERTGMLVKASDKLQKEIETRRLSEDAIDESAQKWRALFEYSSDVVYLTSHDGRFVEINAAGENLLGYTRADLLDLHLGDICKNRNDGKKFQKEIEQKGFVEDYRLIFKKRNGSSISCLVTSQSIRDGAGNIKAYQGIIKEDYEGKAKTGPAKAIHAPSVVEEMRGEIEDSHSFQNIISRNPKVRGIFTLLPQIAESDSTVLIEGRSGTGKELFARAIHNLSKRKHGPFVAINCAALPENLLESELFGYVKGAFTNAVNDKPGRFALADGGTILLDEIGELSPLLQVKLLRVIQEKELEPLGGVKPVKVDVRIVSSTNRTISEEVRKGNFREDLFFRLNVVRIDLPELKDRREDIPLLVDHLLRKIAVKIGRESLGVSDDAAEFLMKYDYPGNVRELENIIESAAVLAEGNTLTLENIVNKLFLGTLKSPAGERVMIRDVVTDAEKKLIEETLNRYQGDRGKTADTLNLDRSTLWRKMKKYGLL